MALGPWQIVIILILALLLFGGGGKISSIMGDFAKGIKAFRKGLQEEDKTDGKNIEDRVDAARDITPAPEATSEAEAVAEKARDAS
ncbi:MAG: twin-arginine translocase TatA/TatE family subunit [Pseudomonadota bacterium]